MTQTETAQQKGQTGQPEGPVDIQLPVYKGELSQPHKTGGSYAPVRIFDNSSYRRCPQCHSKNVKRNGRVRPDKKYRYRCNACKRNFTMNIDAIDLDKLFAEVYDEYYRDIPYMHTTKYRKIRALNENKEVRKQFSAAIAEYTANKAWPDDEADISAFHHACMLATKLDGIEISKYCDSWYYLANYNNSDLTYWLKDYNNELACRYDLANSQVQNLEKPLLHCAKCGSTAIVRQGFNNSGRRRIKCNDCKQISLIRVKHLVTQDEFNRFLQAYFAGMTQDEELIKLLTEKMQNDYYKISVSRHFDALLAEQLVITHSLKKDIFNAFIAAEYLRTKEDLSLKALFLAMNYKGLYDFDKHIPSLPERKNMIGLAHLFFEGLKNLPDTVEPETIKYNRLFYQVAAAMHTSRFHDWHYRAKQAHEAVKESHVNVTELPEASETPDDFVPPA